MAKRSKKNNLLSNVEESKLEKRIRETIEERIGNEVWKILKDHMKKDVYDVHVNRGRWVWGKDYPYGSKTEGYRRRNESGLLSESGKYIHVSHVPGTEKWELLVTTIAQPSVSVYGAGQNKKVGGFIELLEEGNLGFWSRSNNQPFANNERNFKRPLATNAEEEAKKHMDEYYARIEAVIFNALK